MTAAVGTGVVTGRAGRASASGIWRHAEHFAPCLPPETRLSHGEGDTPLAAYPALARACGLDSLWLKREDLNPFGAHKARGAAFQVSALLAEHGPAGVAVISSSGNGAIAAAGYAALAGWRLAACLSPATPPAKLAQLRALDACVLLSEDAMGLAVALAEARDWPNLRPSLDPLAPVGFMSLGWELAEAAVEAEGIFLFASSATALVGMARALDRPLPGCPAWQAPLHVVQGVGADPIAGQFDRRPPPQEGRARVGRLGSRKTRRLGEAVRCIRAGGGSGWTVGDAEADEADGLLRSVGIVAALEAAAALAAVRRAARESGLRRAIVVVTGAGTPDLPEDAALAAARVHNLGQALDRVDRWR